jgi:hypothetical protein
MRCLRPHARGYYVASADRDADAIGREPAADPATIALEAVTLT